MHIGIDISRLGVSARTGTEHYLHELLAALAQLDRHNPYTLYCNQLPAALPPIGPNMALRRIPSPRLWTHYRLSREMLLRPPELLFVPAHVLPLARPRRSVVTIHDLGYEYFPEAHPRAQRLYLRLSTLWSARVATRLIAISGATRHDLIARYGVPAAKIAVVHHGLSPRFRPEPDLARQQAAQARYGIQPPYFLYVGTVQPRKNLVRLVQAFATFLAGDRGTRHVDHNIQLVISGKRGWLTSEIEQAVAQQFGRNDRAVRFTGYVADDDVPALLGGALAFVFPSLYEGFGLPVLEAMACGAPVIAANTSSLPEVAGDAALLVPPTDTAAIARAMRDVATNHALRDELRQKGFARAAQFTWQRCARETLDVLLQAGAARP
ncbi:MAG: glycosyltransferase family 4 protein [Chloroflexales bacterium]|nr:glycosyltransferase family 4 protein [Chloroflexales bacterium]